MLAPCLHLLFVLPSEFITYKVNETYIKTVSCVLFISNFEHYFLQGSLVLNKKLMKKYCKLVSLLSILV